MNLDGEARIDEHVQLLRLLIRRDGVSFEDALSAAAALIPTGDVDQVRARYQAQLSTTIEVLEPGVLSDGGPREWFATIDPSQGYYWRRQRNYLATELKRKDYEVDSLDQSSDRVLSHLEDPQSLSPFDVRGLVVGHVQSGKTANFSALIAKAADSGYKIVIVLSGLHNTLRQQTQKRLERDLGRENVPGVGEPAAGRRWQWMTGAESWADFNPGGVNAAVLQGNEQVIFVVKKNKSRLERLIAWMDGRVPASVPVLVIDDEADQASINTGGNRSARDEVDLVSGADYDGDEPSNDELDPSTINLNVRRLIASFARCSYVAYTATPFANVLIDPNAHDAVAGNDLFPTHFIISLPLPPGDGYVGASALFGRDPLPGESEGSDGLDVIRLIPDYEVDLVVPPQGSRSSFVPTMPDSMKAAVRDFVLAAAARLTRSRSDEPCTMLIHTDMQRAMQNPLGPEVQAELAFIRQRWLYESADYRPTLRAVWESDFRPTSAAMDLQRDLDFESIEPQIDRLLRDGIEVRILNSDWPDTIDFDLEPNLKAVLIGGNKLSRGVTLEGLLISYFVRETLYYDTLMQMGRWFGYRGSYVDLTRIYSTELLVSCFHDLATAEDELRRQIGRYERERLTPTDFVPKVRTHPLMAVTQKSKMQSAVAQSVSYAGERVQTLRFAVRPDGRLKENVDLTRRLLGGLGESQEWNGKPTWSGVSPGEVMNYVRSFSAVPQLAIEPNSLVDYIQEQVRRGELTDWRVLVSANSTDSVDPLWSVDLGVVNHPRLTLISRSRLKSDPSSLGVVTEPGDELFGLTDEQIDAARDAYASRTQPSLAEALRAQRSAQEGLLMIYAISPASQPGKNAKNRVRLFDNPEQADPIVAFALSFPQSSSDATVEYVSAPSPRR